MVFHDNFTVYIVTIGLLQLSQSTKEEKEREEGMNSVHLLMKFVLPLTMDELSQRVNVTFELLHSIEFNFDTRGQRPSPFVMHVMCF